MDTVERIELIKRRHKKALNALRRAGDDSLLFEEPMWEDWKEDYPIDWSDPSILSEPQGKYKIRRRNMRRARNRMQLFAPELMQYDGTKRRVFEMSTAHGSVLEVCRYFGHDVLGNDYVSSVKGGQGKSVLFRRLGDGAPERSEDDLGFALPAENEELIDWVYRPITQAMDIPVHLFDGGVLPYPEPDKAHDYLFCFQAIEHYTHPSDWISIIEEFCRITTTKIVILLNWNIVHTKHIDGYEEAFQKARIEMRDFNKCGFRCTGVHMDRGFATGFTFTASEPTILKKATTKKPASKKTKTRKT